MKENKKCERCETNEGTVNLHLCPYMQEIHDDDSDICNCCTDCRSDCRDDI